MITGEAEQNYAENGTGPVATYTATDPESATITWTLEGDDAALFDLSSGGMLTFMSSPDYENPMDANTDNTYRVTLKASDGTNTDTHNVMVMVTDVDEAPVITGEAEQNYAENGTGPVATYTATDPESATITWTLEGDDAGLFDILGGVLSFNSPPDYENPMDADMDNMYMVTVKADDGTYADTHNVMVTVTNVEEPGIVSLWAGADALTMAPQVGDTITGAVMDPDNPDDDATVESWQWSRTMDTADMSSWMDIQEATDAAYMVTADDTGYYLRVMATYTDAVGTDTAMEYSMPTMMVVGAEAGDALLDRYDVDGDGIEKTEVLKAINDYLFGEGDEAISKPEVLRLINLYLFG